MDIGGWCMRFVLSNEVVYIWQNLSEVTVGSGLDLISLKGRMFVRKRKMAQYFWSDNCSRHFLSNSSKWIPEFWKDISRTWNILVPTGDRRTVPSVVYKDVNHLTEAHCVKSHPNSKLLLLSPSVNVLYNVLFFHQASKSLTCKNIITDTEASVTALQND